MAKKVAGLFVEVLAAAGVERIYGVAGDSLNGITDAVRVRKEIEWVGVRHEETAAFAAGSEAALTGGLCGKLRTGQSAPYQWPRSVESKARLRNVCNGEKYYPASHRFHSRWESTLGCGSWPAKRSRICSWYQPGVAAVRE